MRIQKRVHEVPRAYARLKGDKTVEADVRLSVPPVQFKKVELDGVAVPDSWVHELLDLLGRTRKHPVELQRAI